MSLGAPAPSVVVSRFGMQHVPVRVRSLSTFATPDYIDSFTLDTPAARERSVEEWARAVLEEAALFASVRPPILAVDGSSAWSAAVFVCTRTRLGHCRHRGRLDPPGDPVLVHVRRGRLPGRRRPSLAVTLAPL